jgi:hypothetical protein
VILVVAVFLLDLRCLLSVRDVNVFFVKDVLPPMTSTVGITTTAFAARHPDKVNAIVAGRRCARRSRRSGADQGGLQSRPGRDGRRRSPT